jgi:hypothetical protein
MLIAARVKFASPLQVQEIGFLAFQGTPLKFGRETRFLTSGVGSGLNPAADWHSPAFVIVFCYPFFDSHMNFS